MRIVIIRLAMLAAALLPWTLLESDAWADSRAADSRLTDSRAGDCPQADHAAVVQTLNRLYAAAGAHDADGLRSVTSSDFALQEEGGKVDGDALIQRLAGTPVANPAAHPAEKQGAEPAADRPGEAADRPGEATASGGAARPGPTLAISDPEVHILCDSAWATFRAPAAMGGGESAGTRSAVLNHQADGWRVRFLNDSIHAAPAAEETATRTTGQRSGSGRSHGSRSARSTGKGRGKSGAASGGKHRKPHQHSTD